MTIAEPVKRTIEDAFFDTSRSASKVALLLSTIQKPLHAGDVRRVWNEARKAGRLPNIRRARAPRGNKVRAA